MIIDLRSDTVTKPSQAMLDAMMSAVVGDNVFAEDPTVDALEKKCAEMFAHESALFCPSGTMTNQIAIKVHTQPGDELLCDATAHIYNYEGGGISSNSGVQAKLIQGDRGRISATQVLENINPTYDWLTHTSLVCVENTVNKSGGSIYELEELKKLSNVSHQNNLKFHMDGARIFNALVETKTPTKEIGSLFDSISVCFSKGLGAPVGSVLIGNTEFINKARRIRKVFGGGMRQSGYLAAAAIYALENNIERLAEDHHRAKQLEKTIQSLPYVKSCMQVETNIVIFELQDEILANEFVLKAKAKNLLCTAFSQQHVRLVTHLDITDEMLFETEKILHRLY